MLEFLILFLFGLLSDAAWVACARASTTGRPYYAALYGSLQHGLTLASTYSVIANQSLLGALAFIAGGALGTYHTTKLPWKSSSSDPTTLLTTVASAVTSAKASTTPTSTTTIETIEQTVSLPPTP